MNQSLFVEVYEIYELSYLFVSVSLCWHEERYDGVQFAAYLSNEWIGVGHRVSLAIVFALDAVDWQDGQWVHVLVAQQYPPSLPAVVALLSLNEVVSLVVEREACTRSNISLESERLDLLIYLW